MRIQFTAEQTASTEDGGAIICGAQGNDGDGNEHYLTISRAAEDGDEDWGVHIEFDDQLYSDYGLISRCRVSKNGLSVDLGKRIKEMEDVAGFDVTWSLKEDPENMIEGLRRIFRATGMLEVDAA